LEFLSQIPKPPASEAEGAYAVYQNELRAFRSSFAKMHHEIDYYLLKCSSNVQEYYYMKNEVLIKDLWKFIINYYTQ